MPARNEIFESARFNERFQKQGESIDEYLTALYTLCERCNYGALRDRLIRDRFVVGILDKPLSEQLQVLTDVSLENAVKKARLKENVHGQQQVIKNVDQDDLTPV